MEVCQGWQARTRYSRNAKATFRKDRRLNIRLSSEDLQEIQKRAIAEGLPYQTLISSLSKVRVRPAQGSLEGLRIDNEPDYPEPGRPRASTHTWRSRRSARIGTVQWSPRLLALALCTEITL